MKSKQEIQIALKALLRCYEDFRSTTPLNVEEAINSTLQFYDDFEQWLYEKSPKGKSQSITPSQKKISKWVVVGCIALIISGVILIFLANH